MKWLAILVVSCVSSVAFAQAEGAEPYNKGVSLMELGKAKEGRKVLLDVIKDFPTTTYAKYAKDLVVKPIISSIDYKDVAPLSEREIRKRLELANSDLMVNKVYKPESNDQVRQMLAGMIMKKKAKAKDVTVTAKDLPDHMVAVTIAVVR